MLLAHERAAGQALRESIMAAEVRAAHARAHINMHEHVHASQAVLPVRIVFELL